MRKTLALLMATLLLLASVLTHAEDTPPPSLPVLTLGEGINIVIYETLFDLEACVASLSDVMQGIGFDLKNTIGQITVVPTLAEAQMMVSSGRADAFIMFYDSMKYLASKDERLDAVEAMISVDLRLIGATGQEAHMAKINEALQEMLEDGTADALWETHVMSVIEGNEPSAITMPTIEGAETIRVGISGDCPPMDYTTANGNPAGYNTALLSELSRRANINIELQFIDNGARFIALESGKIDFFFWHHTFGNMPAFLAALEGTSKQLSELMDNLRADNGYLLSDTYRTVKIGWLVKKE